MPPLYLYDHFFIISGNKPDKRQRSEIQLITTGTSCSHTDLRMQPTKKSAAAQLLSKKIPVACLFLLTFFYPEQAKAFQPHDYSGLYAHQFAHFFLIVSLFVFAVRAQRTRYATLKGWRCIIAGNWLLILWSLTTMTGHFIDLYIPPESFMVTLPGQTVPSIRITSWMEILFYALKMDHLIAVPAVFLFYRGIAYLSRHNTEKRIGA